MEADTVKSHRYRDSANRTHREGFRETTRHDFALAIPTAQNQELQEKNRSKPRRRATSLPTALPTQEAVGSPAPEAAKARLAPAEAEAELRPPNICSTKSYTH